MKITSDDGNFELDMTDKGTRLKVKTAKFEGEVAVRVNALEYLKKILLPEPKAPDAPEDAAH